jgi:hypothetical protein
VTEGDVVRLILAFAAVAGLSACGSSRAGGSEAEAVVATFEKMVPLPEAARPLPGYERFYLVTRDRIAAVYLVAQSGSGRIHLVDQGGLPEAKAEGCSVVNVVFERGSNRFAQILCNPVLLSRAELAPTAVRAPGREPAPGGAVVDPGGIAPRREMTPRDGGPVRAKAATAPSRWERG